MIAVDTYSDAVRRTVHDLVIANRILADKGVLDAYGHVSARHPENPSRFFQSVSLAPELVTVDDIAEFDLDGVPLSESRPAYKERFIHSSLYAARPDFSCIVHAHTESILPFTLTDIPLRPVVHDASAMGAFVPVWDIRDDFGENTDLLVTSPKIGDSLAVKLGTNRAVLMRGHGFAAGAGTVSGVVRMCVYMARNAEVLTTVLLLGRTPIDLSSGEIAARDLFDPMSAASRRSWDYWAAQVGFGDLL
ncbi:class II aldolase/adducin family protein [Amycolatopsis pithecellobii]|uniref:Class II aldolase/adducin family protein n=1 Tax=Amycolatopsis pithecellobii TaxID=664692 RepID=A0A6N7Z676_9PSEU|nr:class II aldolase/adducin family protein [Amycolatopsis pithecellobii]MTD57993.1 class II aldolase/adducin family protein [Amycolatopsis pithecellobii]